MASRLLGALLRRTVGVICKAADITDLHFHDLRGTAITMLAEAGCDAPEIASINGHFLSRCTQFWRNIWRPRGP